MESPSAWARLGEGGKNGSQASRSATAIEDMFSACGKSRPDLPTRNAYRTIRGGRAARGVLSSRDFEDGNVAETSTMQARCALLKRIRSLAPWHGSSLDWENLSDAERNLRVRLSETRP